MTPEQIRAAITASPDLQALLPDTVALAAALSVGRTEVYPRMTSARGLAELYPTGPIGAEVVLMKLEGAAAAMKASSDQQQKVLGSLIARQLGFLAGDGLDFGSAALRGMLDQFATLGILTADEVAGLKSIALRDDVVTPSEVERALLAASVTWTGVVQSVTTQNGMVYVTIRYTSTAGVERVEQTHGDDLTPAAVAALIAKRTASMSTADAAAALFG